MPSSMAFRRVGCFWLALLVGALAVAANVEKTIFVASDAVSGGRTRRAGDAASDSSDLGRFSALPRLTPDRNAWRTSLPAAFPWADNFPANGTTWMLLDELQPGQRYELRVCWAATQPTAFSVDVFDLTTVALMPDLAASLAEFVSGLSRNQNGAASSSTPSELDSQESSVLRIVAAADYIAADRSAMHPDCVPSVLTDIILDPYLLNVLPRSLLPTVTAILAVAVASAWLAGRVILPQLRAVATEG